MAMLLSVGNETPVCRPSMTGGLNETAKVRLDALDADPAGQHAEHTLKGAGKMSGIREATGIGSFGQVLAGSIRRDGKLKAQSKYIWPEPDAGFLQE